MKKALFSALALFIALALSPVISVKTIQAVQKRRNTQTVQYITKSNGTTVCELSDFIYGVCASQMPATYETEAIKAQAVCVHSLVLYLLSRGEPISFESMSYRSEDELRELWATKYDYYSEKLHGAVDSVFDKTLQYNGKPAMALSHALNGGKTSAYEGFPYLQSVESSGDLLSPDSKNALSENAFGLSRYGADFMARQGFTFEQILAHYFPGTELAD